MKKTLFTLLLTIIFSLSVSAQKISKPTLTSIEPTPAQEKLIQEGIAFYDSKKYDEAIVKYKQVLEENKDCTVAMYELAITYYAVKNLKNALEVSLIGARYKSKQLPIFYQTIASVFDDQGEPKKAIELYNTGIKLLKDGKGNDQHLSSLYFNLGITHFRQKQYSESREALKKSVENNYSYASPNYLLSVIFNGTKYKVPALLAAGRFISLENNTQRSNGAAKIIQEILNGSVQKGDKPNSITILMDLNAPTDEGDFGAIELFLGISKVSSDTLEENKNKTEEEKFVEQIESFIALLLETSDKKIKNTFVGKYYIPFFAEMKSKAHIEAFSYLIMQETGNREADKWISANNKKIFDFLEWAKNYNR